ncbi:MAG: hypothetical protein Q9217_000448 [Psora testacea]
MGKYVSSSEDEGHQRSHGQRQRSRDYMDENSSNFRWGRRSPSPDDGHQRVGRRGRRRYPSASRSPPRRSRAARDRRRHSSRDRSRSRSPPPPNRRRDDGYERHLSHRKGSRDSSLRRQRQRHQRSSSPQPSGTKRSTAPLPSQQAAFSEDTAKDLATTKSDPPAHPSKQKPNFALSGLLAAETNTVANTDIVLKYNEPPEARLPPASQSWRLYIFKSSDLLETLDLHERTCWLFGREKAVVDHTTEHPSCSKQHAVIQFRYTEKRDEWGERKGRVRPYVIDLESANGTTVNGKKIPEKRYIEVKSGDVLMFGESTREYVVLLPPKE